MAKPAVAIKPLVEERREVEGLASRGRTEGGLALCAQIADWLESREICTEQTVDPNSVGSWRRRSAGRRLVGVIDEPCPGAPHRISNAKIAETIRAMLQQATRWSLCSMTVAVNHAP